MIKSKAVQLFSSPLKGSVCKTWPDVWFMSFINQARFVRIWPYIINVLSIYGQCLIYVQAETNVSNINRQQFWFVMAIVLGVSQISIEWYLQVTGHPQNTKANIIKLLKTEADVETKLDSIFILWVCNFFLNDTNISAIGGEKWSFSQL